ncbi:hypothetical protein [Desulfosporosinus fructosivorans]
MNKKKYIIGTTLAFLLCITTNVFAFTMGCVSYLNTGTFFITSSSKTTATVTCSNIYAYNGLYQDGVLKKQTSKEVQNATSVTTSENSITNSMGDQLWQSYGVHSATSDGTTYVDSSSTTRTW